MSCSGFTPLFVFFGAIVFIIFSVLLSTLIDRWCEMKESMSRSEK